MLCNMFSVPTVQSCAGVHHKAFAWSPLVVFVFFYLHMHRRRRNPAMYNEQEGEDIKNEKKNNTKHTHTTSSTPHNIRNHNQ